MRSNAWGLIFLLCASIHVYLALPAITAFSPTYDEPVHLTAGVATWKTGDYRFNGYHHPAFGEMWPAIPVVFLNPIVPTQDPAWIRHQWSPKDQYAFANTFLYRNRVSPDRMMAWGRGMQLVLSCVGGLLIVLTAWSLGGLWAASFAGMFWAFSPAFLMNGTIISTDLSFACFFFGFFACLRNLGDRKIDVFAGLCLGLAFASKYFAVSIIPITLLLLVLDRSLRRKLDSWFLLVSVGFFTLALVYQFTNLDVFWTGLTDILGRSQQGRSSFFMGKHGTQGWLLYFPALLLFKTPIPLLVGLLMSLIGLLRKKILVPVGLWIPPLAFFLVSCFSKVQIGHRHILVVYPFLFVLAAMGLNSLFQKKQWIYFPLFIWLGTQAVFARPNFLPYFNEFIGGAAEGYRYFTDSNVDWGQGLKPLGEGLSAEDKEKGIYLSYFGVADPHHYGIRYLDIGSDTIVSRTDDTIANLQPTKLAISVTNLQGTYFADHAAFDWLKKYNPIQKFAHSIFLYDFSNQPEALAELRRMRS